MAIDNPKALVELPKTVIAADVTDTTKWYMEIGFVTDVNLESGKILMSELITLIDTDTTATASNVGAGTGLIFKQKTGIDLEFKSLIAGANITINNNASDIEIIAAAGGSTTRIENGATTTFVDTDLGSYSNQVVVGSSLVTTGIIFTAQSDTGGTPADVFEINGNGALSNNGVGYYQYVASNTHIFGSGAIRAGTGNNNIFVGHAAGANFVTGANNSVLGFQAGLNLSTGSFNSILGNGAGYQLVGGDYNVCMGYQAGYNINGADNNTYIGTVAGREASGKTGNVRIGFSAGRYNNTSNQLFIDNQDRTNAAGELTDSLIVGTFNATASSQTIRVNAKFAVNADPLTNQVAGDCLLEGGSLILKEITTPTADANYAKVYTKADNKLYFQDGAGVEHLIVIEDASGDVTITNEITAADFILA